MPVAKGFADVRQDAVHEQGGDRLGSFAVHARESGSDLHRQPGLFARSGIKVRDGPC
jgi:hypothetical protein